MKTSARGREDLVHSEGLRLKAYRDSVGVWTIGVGHTANAGPPVPRAGLTITRQQAMDILADDLAMFEARVRKYLGDDVPQHVFDGAVSFDFNTGGIHKASWVGAYKRGLMASARSLFMKWRKPPEIIGRRTREAQLIFEGKYYTKGPAVETPAPADGPHREDIIREAQAMLAKLGYSPGPIDGIEGEKTRAATLAYQKADPELADDGWIGPMTMAALRIDTAVKPPTQQPDDPGVSKPAQAAPEGGFLMALWRALKALLGIN